MVPRPVVKAAAGVVAGWLVLTAGAPVGEAAAAPTGSARSSGSPQFVPGACPRTPKPIPALADARCGVLVVPENRGRPGGPTIRLTVAVIPARSSSPAPDPVVHMTGGPGSDAIDDAQFLVDAGVNRDRDLIIMTQRGTLYAEPSLACPEVDRFYAHAVGLRYDAVPTKRLLVGAMGECRDRLTGSGIDLGAYNTSENAADFADLRTALGIARWNVYGYSYGTDLALTFLREHPEGIRTVTIDSVVPPQIVSLPWTWSSAGEGINAILRACRDQPACDDRYPRLARTLTRQVRKLEADPLTLRATPPGGGQEVEVVLDGGALVNLLVGNSVPSADVPAAIDELAHGDPHRFASARAAGSTPVIGDFAYGLTESVACGEWVPGRSADDLLEAGRRAFPGYPDSVLAQAPQLPYQSEVCRTWDVPDRTSSQRVATRSTVPTLILSGTFDAKTGARWGRFAARTLPDATVVRVPGIGHWVTPQSPCAQSVLASFLADPAAVDTECVGGLKPKPFTIT
ncbi:alpha/beta fold hydrolase [Kitasatospora sp. NPDC048722]|uniref:alpha/beta hydrolase n=1 Tax=Kitasatospora sp. NPDC048722 TaxID=3155639 RepID=UPI0033F70783